MNKLVTYLMLAGSVLAAAPQLAQAAELKSVAFAGAAQPIVKFKTAKAVVSDAQGKALFQGDQEYVLRFANNPEGKVFEWRPADGTVRISPPGGAPAWLDCGDVEPMGLACSDLQLVLGPDGNLRISGAARPTKGEARGFSLARPAQGGAAKPVTRGFSAPARKAAPARGGGLDRGGVPNCPGDPRCPKMGGS